ncbi:MAG: sugar phosphate isomerase/epimerase [Anaerolineae bacterium]|nr:MAG: sugar phosphate isomerase/epimerase [Anaerolineae bacterium]
MNPISFMSANYVGRQVSYNITEGWMQGENAAIAHFKPVETYAERLDEVLRDVRGLGFEAIDIWLAHLGPGWATERHIEVARDRLKQHRLNPVSLAGWFGATAEEFERSCKLAAALNITILGGITSLLETDRPTLVRLLKEYNLRLALENHAEKTPEALLARIGDGGEGTIGAALDTGWFATQGYDPVDAVRKLGQYIFHVHLNDVMETGTHHTCRYGAGIVPVEGCVRALQKIGYEGVITIEHEPEQFDPTEDIRASFAMLREWLS